MALGDRNLSQGLKLQAVGLKSISSLLKTVSNYGSLLPLPYYFAETMQSLKSKRMSRMIGDQGRTRGSK